MYKIREWKDWGGGWEVERVGDGSGREGASSLNRGGGFRL